MSKSYDMPRIIINIENGKVSMVDIQDGNTVVIIQDFDALATGKITEYWVNDEGETVIEHK